MEEPRASPPSAKTGKSWDSPRFPLTFCLKIWGNWPESETLGNVEENLDFCLKSWGLDAKLEWNILSWPLWTQFLSVLYPPPKISLPYLVIRTDFQKTKVKFIIRHMLIYRCINGLRVTVSAKPDFWWIFETAQIHSTPNRVLLLSVRKGIIG